MTWTQVHQTIAAGPVAAVGAGATLSDGWIDKTGSQWVVNADGFFQDAVAPNSTTPWQNAALLRPIAEALIDQQIQIRFKYTPATTQAVYGMLRVTGSAGALSGYLCAFSTNQFKAYKMTGAAPAAVTLTPTGTFTPVLNTLYDLQFNCVTSGSNTVLTVSILDTSGTLLYSATGTDATVALQGVSGVAGICAANLGSTIIDAWSQATTFTSASAAATAITLTGPSAGATGVASTNFTVGANGNVSAATVVTPSDGGAGGTFTPTTVTIPSGTSTAQTFTYTPSSAGAKTISVTNNQSLTNPSSLTYTATTTATAYTLTGPSTGTVGTNSTAFTITSNGNLASAVTVTPSDGDVGGTFTPSTVSLAIGSNTSATFVYSAAAAAAITISSTNNGSLTNPSSLTYTASAASTITVPVTSTAFRFSPGNWKGDTGRGGSVYRQTWCVGAFFEFAWNASASPTAQILIPSISGNGCTLNYILNGVMVDAVAATGPVTIAPANIIPSSPNVIKVFLKLSTLSSRWSNGTSTWQVQGMLIDSASSVGVATTYTKWARIVGDSITEGTLAYASAGSNMAAYSHLLGEFLTSQGIDYGVTPCGSNGWLQAGDTTGDIPAWYFVGSGGYVAASSRWNLIDSGVSVLDSNNHISAYGGTGQEPYLVYINLMTNEAIHALSTTFAQAAVQQWLVAERMAAPNAFIFVQVPFGLYNASVYTNAATYIASLKAGVAAYKAANPADLKVILIDFGATFGKLMSTYTSGSAGYVNTDQIHPTVNGHALVAPKICSAVIAGIQPSRTRFWGAGGAWF